MLITIATYTNPIEAYIIRGRFETEGIPAFVIHDNHIWANWFLSNALGGVKVQVSPVDVVRALNLEKGIRDLDFESILKESEESSEIISCPKCDSLSIKECRGSENLALFVLWLYSVPIPYVQGKFSCISCSKVWVSKKTKAYPLFVKFIAGFIAAIFFIFVIEGLNSVCKAQALNMQCYQ